MSASLFARGVTVVRGARVILDRVDVAVVPGRRTGLVGPNGVGKSTLLGVLAGEVAPDKGTVVGGSADRQHRPPGAGARATRRRDRARTAAAPRRRDRRPGPISMPRRTPSPPPTPGADDRYSIALERWLAIGATDFEARIGEVVARARPGRAAARAADVVAVGRRGGPHVARRAAAEPVRRLPARRTHQRPRPRRSRTARGVGARNSGPA